MFSSTPRSVNHSLTYCLLFTTIGWTLYVVLMKLVPAPFAHEYLRAVIRVALVLLPALYYVAYCQRKSLLDALQLRQNWGKGVIVGGGVATIYLLFIILPHSHDIVFKLPVRLSTWLNYIIGSPLAEEVLYRGIVFQQLRHRMPNWKAMFISTATFTALHIPVWVLMNGYGTTEVMISSLQITVYGIVFATIFSITRSLWAPLTAHWLNNLIMSLLVRG